MPLSLYVALFCHSRQKRANWSQTISNGIQLTEGVNNSEGWSEGRTESYSTSSNQTWGYQCNSSSQGRTQGNSSAHNHNTNRGNSVSMGESSNEANGVGSSQSSSEGGSYSVNYTPQIIPKLDEAQLRCVLSPVNQGQILILKDGRTIIDGKANWDLIETLSTRVNGPKIPNPPQFELLPRSQYNQFLSDSIPSFDEHLLVLEEIERTIVDPEWQEIPSVLGLGMEVNSINNEQTQLKSFQEIVNLGGEIKEKMVELERSHSSARLIDLPFYNSLKRYLKYLHNCQISVLNHWSQEILHRFQTLIPAAQQYLEKIQLYAEVIIYLENGIQHLIALVESRFEEINDYQQELQAESQDLIMAYEEKMERVEEELDSYRNQLIDYQEKSKIWTDIPSLTIPDSLVNFGLDSQAISEQTLTAALTLLSQLKVYYELELPVFEPIVFPEFPEVISSEIWADFFTFFERIEEITIQQNTLDEQANQIVQNLPSRWNLGRREERLRSFNYLNTNRQNDQITRANYHQILAYYPLIEQQIKHYFNSWLYSLQISAYYFQELQQRKQSLLRFQDILLEKLAELEHQNNSLNIIRQALGEIEKFYAQEYHQKLQVIKTWNIWKDLPHT